jgi:hypothetical protein
MTLPKIQLLAILFPFVLASAVFGEPAPVDLPQQTEVKQPIALANGPHLLIDDYLIAKRDGVERKVMQPKRFLKEPIVTSGPEHQNWQPWFTVLRDPSLPQEKRFRMWYDADTVDDPAEGAFGPVLGYLESADGIYWPGPYQRLEKIDSILFGGSVVDDGPQCPTPSERYKVMYFSSRAWGPVVAFSPEGLHWTMHNNGKSILKEGIGNDSWHASYDPIRQRYFLIGKSSRPYSWTNAEGQKVSRSMIRAYSTSFSKDFKTWTDPKLVFIPDEKDPGITEWYAAVGFQVRGDLIIAFLQVLRDDLTAEGAPKEAVDCNLGNPGAGMGHTVLAWTRDGETWHRDRETDAFLEPVPEVGAWDHAMAWVSSVVPMGDEVYLYYAGFRWGHKYQRSVDRQIGLVKTKRDRYVARQAGEQEGVITTPLVTLTAKALTLNADAVGGEVRLQVTDAEGKPLPGFSFADCQPIASDGLDEPVQFRQPLSELRDEPVHIEFKLRNARLFAFNLSN